MELRQLEYFQKVSKLKNFTKAAEALHVSQPSVTNSIRKLEEELGVVLLDRNKKRVYLTEEGKVFLNRIDKILFELNDTLLEIRDLKCLDKGQIKLGLPPMIGAHFFPNMFTKFSKDYPNLDLQVYEEGSINARQLIEKGDLDLGLIILPKNSKQLDTIEIFKTNIVLCVSKDHRLCNCKEVCFTELENEDFILLKDDSFHRRAIMQRCHQHKLKPRVIFSSNQIETIKALVASGVGISFLLEMAARDTKDIVAVPLTETIETTIGLAWRKDKYLSKATKSFIDFIKNYTESPDFKGF
ncbi:DNA-binding transcriptional regulator, LysR family [Desulfonispora thiosulfatigenes DSM 11270]|uniref:DNA-binding transcriptional regulator, LysR family n=1 Tax=Desulfonispora thiosulfatigenes DSM 11270 TaxID=656914 RepID=A0A1W1V2M5_DESTI|nr:LysR family transcriptional regulator [Desulfonispora thiosulfatigenes]SMB87585.1 DNA-binding transcriptional regulator, LysR family [Desulfonispora thiosulfatigenes DSM 11270]